MIDSQELARLIVTNPDKAVRKLRRLRRALAAETPKQQRWREEFIRLRNQFGLTGWSLRYKSMHRALGKCYYAKQQISLSRQFVEKGQDDQIMDTLLHELAHALVGPGHKHGPVWQAKAKEIGARPEAKCRVGVRLLDKGWMYKCPTGCFEVVRKRIPKHHLLFGVRCATCNATIVPHKWEETKQ